MIPQRVLMVFNPPRRDYGKLLLKLWRARITVELLIGFYLQFLRAAPLPDEELHLERLYLAP
jgi:hypothetical protein